MAFSPEEVERKVREALAKEEALTATFESLYRQLVLLEAAINERNLTLTTLENLKKASGESFLIPLGGAVFVPGRLSTEFILAAVGGGYYVKCSADEAIRITEGNLEELVTLRKTTAERLEAVTRELNKVREDIRNLMQVLRTLR